MQFNSKEVVEGIINKAGAKATEEQKKMMREFTTNVVQKGQLPQQAIGLSDDAMEAIYSHAYRLYNSGRFKDSQTLFQFMMMLNPLEKKYALGSAASFHMMKDYPRATSVYALCAALDPTDPMNFYYASDCYLQMGKIEHALATLKTAMERSGDKKMYEPLINRGKLTLQFLEERIKQEKGAKKEKKKTETKKKVA